MPSWGGAAKGAGTGAAIGSFVPVVGTGLGAGIGGLIGGLFGGGDKKDDPQAAGVAGGTDFDSLAGSLRTSATERGDRADRIRGEGDDALAQVTSYFSKLAGGDAAAVAQATQAQRGRIIDQYDSARKAIAEFSPRGGGTTSVSAQSRIDQANQITDVTADAQSDAAKSLAALGINMEQIGLSEEQLKSADLNTLISAILAKDTQKLNERGQTLGAATGLAEGLGQILGLFLTRNKAGATG